MPKLIKRSRAKGWRKPEGEFVNASRPGPWGNPFRVGDSNVPDKAKATRLFELLLGPLATVPGWMRARPELMFDRAFMLAHLPELRGKDLMCWCADWTFGEGPRPDCHAAVLLEEANR